MNYLEFDFETTGQDQAEQLVALLSELGFEGFEEGDLYLEAFIPETAFNENSFAAVVELFPFLSYTQSVVENINWNRKWEESFEPVMVGNFVGIRAGFHSSLLSKVQFEIIITPKMSFGTGHHATTHLMIRQMQELDFKDKKVFDFGTGTGVLAILAEKLGASKVEAIDNDEWSIINAKENILQNSCSQISVDQADSIPGNEQFDIILANINLNVIVNSLPELVNNVSKSATILLSGFLKENEPAIKSILEQVGLKYLSTEQKGEWICIKANKS